MFNNLKFFLDYRRQNKIFSKALEIKRDRKIELYFLFGLWRSKRFENILKRNCRCYLAYYKERNIEVSFKDLNYITARILAIYNILYDKELLKTELNNFENIFSREYVRNKLSEFGIGDTLKENLVKEAVM